MEIICDNCAFKNNMKFPSELEGKKVQFQCKNNHCDHMISTILTIDTSDHITALVNIDSIKITGGLLQYQIDSEKVLNYQLKKGVNIIGRKSSTHMPHIAIETKDKYMSRTHCSILQKESKNGDCEFILKDYSSSNSTKLNNKPLKAEDEFYLINDDTILMGNTTLIFKTSYI